MWRRSGPLSKLLLSSLGWLQSSPCVHPRQATARCLLAWAAVRRLRTDAAVAQLTSTHSVLTASEAANMLTSRATKVQAVRMPGSTS